MDVLNSDHQPVVACPLVYLSAHKSQFRSILLQNPDVHLNTTSYISCYYQDPNPSTMSIFPREDAQAIMALREQIMANATVLLPKVVNGKRKSLFAWGHPSANVLFEIAILSVNDASAAQAIAESAAPMMKYQAILTHGMVQKTSTAAVGDISGSVYGALESLLAVTANELGNRKGKDLIKSGERSGAGVIEKSLFEEKPSLTKRMKPKKK